MELRKSNHLQKIGQELCVNTLGAKFTENTYNLCVCVGGEVMPKDGVHATNSSHFKGNKRNFMLSQTCDHSLALWLYLITAHVTVWKAGQELF